MPTKNRGVFVTFGMAFMVAGWVLAGLIGNPIQQHTLSPIIPGMCEPITAINATTGATTATFANWRVAYLIGAIPIIYAILLFFFMKETPAWYVTRGRLDDAIARLEQLEAQHGSGEKLDKNDIIIPPKPKKSSPSELFSRKYIVGTAAIWCLYSIGQFCVYGMNTWLPSWFKGIGYTASQAVTLQTWNNVAAIVSNVTVGFISDLIGRRKNVIISWILAAALIIICSIFVTGPGVAGGSDQFGLCIVLMLLFGFALNYSITAVQPLMPEYYPTNIRNMGVSWCQAFARFAGASSSIVLGAISTLPVFTTVNAAGETVTSPTAWNTIVLFLIIPFAIALICSILFVQKETKGKSMDELQVEMETEVA
jgi:MFS family permease